MKILETATSSNFFLEGYLMANQDVAANVGLEKDKARLHFQSYGEKEGRSQITAAFFEAGNTYAPKKYERFLPILKGTDFRFLGREGGFPVAYTTQHFSLEDYVAESANATYAPFAEAIAANPQDNFLDIGCGLRPEVFDNCLYVEVYPSLAADVVVAPDCRYPFISESFDGIGCFAVLEHVTKPWEVVAEMHRMLKPGGKVYICWPFLQPVHGYPSHYYNATRQGVELMFSDGFSIDFCRTEGNEGPDSTISWILGEFIARLPPEKQTLIRGMSVGDLVAQPRFGPFWTDLLSGLPDDVISQFACGNTLVASKR